MLMRDLVKVNVLDRCVGTPGYAEYASDFLM
jgi:hypothetical protein